MSSSSNDENYTPEKERRKRRKKMIEKSKAKVERDKVKKASDPTKSRSKKKKVAFQTEVEQKKQEKKTRKTRAVIADSSSNINSDLSNAEDDETFGLGTSHAPERIALSNSPEREISDNEHKSVKRCQQKRKDTIAKKCRTSHQANQTISEDSSDETFVILKERRVSKTKCDARRRKKGKVHDYSTERTRRSKQIRHDQSITPLEEGFPFPDPEICPPNYLGPMDNECPHCAALHFSGRHICCINGKVFIPPLPKLPEPLQTLFHSIRNSIINKFLDNVIAYNSNFSFASMRYSRQPVGPFGVQAERVRGAVNHFSSAVEPHEGRTPVFGNVYVFQGKKAVKERMKSQFASDFDEQIVEEIQQMLQEHNPLVDMYYSMGKKIEALRDSGENIERLRLKIVDPSQVNSQQLQAHEGVYGKPASYKDYVALFYTSSIEQQVTLPGYIVYPKHGFHISRPIFSWSDLINPMCYPLLFPRGERGWSIRKYPYCSDRKSSKDRLEEYAASHRDEVQLWDTPIQHFRHVSRVDPNVVDSGSEFSDEDDENLEDNAYNDQVHEVVETDAEEGDNEIVFEEHNGEMYPTRIRQLTRQVPDQDDLMNEIEHDEDGEFVNENTEAVNTVANEESLLRDEPNVEGEHPHEVQHRKYASYRDCILYQMQQRRFFRNRFSASGQLGQLYLIDCCTRLFKDRSEYIQKHHTEFMSSTPKKFLEAYNRRIAESGRQIGCITSILSSVPGSPRYLQKKYEDVVALSNQQGPPDLFITFTANVHWPEIQNVIPPGRTWADFPFVVNEVFWKKFAEFKKVVLGEPFESQHSVRHPGLFGRVKWWSYSVEFQQRGPPHVHMIISLVDHIRTAADIDKICQATIPPEPHPNDENYEEKARLRKLICDLMIHRPCENDPNAYCQKNKPSHWKTCKKHFPKPFSNDTHFGDLTYPELKRPNDGSFVLIPASGGRRKFIKATNQHVVPHNIQLTSMFGCHINIEVIAALRSVKYIFKYEFKGYDRTLVETITSSSNQVSAGNLTIDGHIIYPKTFRLTPEIIEARNSEARALLRENNISLLDENGSPMLIYDETHFIEDLRSLTSCEAAWEFAGYPRTECSHTVVTVFVHEPHGEPIHYELNTEEEEFQRLQANEVSSRLKAWFKLNESQDLHAQTLCFPQIPLDYRYVKDHWVARKIRLQNLIGRTKAVNPRNKELFAISLLSSNRTNITSFPSLRTVDGVVFPTFVGAAKSLNLMNDRREWDFALSEAARDKMPLELRRLFASILLFCAPEDPLDLWEKHKEEFYENKADWSTTMKEAHALFHIQSILRYHGYSLSQRNLPVVIEDDLPPAYELCNDGGLRVLPPSKAEHIANGMYQKMNEEQKNVFDTIINSVVNHRRKSFFINGSGGCGKTFVYNALCYKLSVNYKVLCVAHTGIAAILLPGGRTSHRAFHIPLTTEDDMHCRVNMEDDIALELAAVNVVLWDEATMTDRRILEAVHRLMCALHSNDPAALFGGVPFVFGGDWKQTLPILKEVRGAGILQYTMLRSELWENIKVLQLTKNVRALNDPEYANFLMNVGLGQNKDRTLAEEDQKIDLPNEMVAANEKEVIDYVFGNGQVLNTSTNAAILTADNASSIAINDQVLKLLPGDSREYKSIDTFDENSGFAILGAEVYNQLTPKGMPPHKLNLKVGAVVMLLRNINTDLALCNGTRLKILKLGNRVLTCEPVLKEANSPNVVYLPRMVLSTSIQANSRDLAFHRFQFSIRLSYAMTIHKAQGQTLAKVGVILRTPVFSHGQLYVALSRVRSVKDIKIFNITPNNSEATNVVYKSIFPLI